MQWVGLGLAVGLNPQYRHTVCMRLHLNMHATISNPHRKTHGRLVVETGKAMWES